MEQVQQAQTAQVQEPTTQPVQTESQPTQVTAQKETLNANDFSSMSDEEKIKVIQQIEAAQNGGQSEPQQTAEPVQQDNTYSLDEFNAIDLAKQNIDPERLPDVGRDIHKKYMDYYNGKILPQLQELQRIKEAQQPQQQQQYQPTFNDVVAMRVMQNLGTQQLDMQDPRTMLEISKQSNLLAQELQQMQQQEAQAQAAQQQIQGVFAQIRKEVKDYDTIDKWAKDELQNLPYKTYTQILDDLRTGDYGKTKAVYDFFTERYAQQHGGKPTQEAAGDTPPSVLGGSMGEPPAKSFSYKEFGDASEDQQKQMLIDAGLI